MAAISNALDLNKLNFMNNTGYIVNSENGIFYFLFCSLIYLTEKQVLCPCYMKKHHSIEKYFNTLLIFMSFFLFWPLYKGNTTLSPEVADRMIPVFSLIRTAVWNFELPLWNPFQDQGWATALVPTFWNPVHLILGDRKSTSLNSSHMARSYAVCTL